MKAIYAILTATLAAALLTGCTASRDSHYVDAEDTTAAIKNRDRMSSSDWIIIAQHASEALLGSPELDEFLKDYAATAKKRYAAANPAGEEMPARLARPLLMLSTVRNNTGEHIDTKLLTERLRDTLFRSGKVRFTTYAAGEGQNADPATAEARKLAGDPNVKATSAMKPGEVLAYDLSLAGVIIKQTASEGREREISYTFSLTLTDNRTGEGVWTYTREIKRQDTKGGFGW